MFLNTLLSEGKVHVMNSCKGLYIGICCILLLCAAGPSAAGTLNVGSGEKYAKIQDAIEAAVNGDEVVVEAGIYLENLNFMGKEIQLKSAAGAENTIIDGASKGTVVSFARGEPAGALLEGFTVKNGVGTKILGLEYGFGGGILCIGSAPTIRGNIIEQNNADPAGGLFGLGGGICAYDGASPTIARNIIRNNRAELGGAIFVRNKDIRSAESGMGAATVENNIIHANSAMKGGGVFIGGNSSPRITNNTIADNASEAEGGGIHVDYGSAPSVTNTILWNNGDDLSGATADMVSYCNIEDGDFAGASGNISGDPLFLGADDYHLSAISPCIDSGTETGAPADDIDGDARPFDGDNSVGPATDIGADEYSGGLSVLRQ